MERPCGKVSSTRLKFFPVRVRLVCECTNEEHDMCCDRMRNGDCLLGSELHVCISRPTGAASVWVWSVGSVGGRGDRANILETVSSWRAAGVRAALYFFPLLPIRIEKAPRSRKPPGRPAIAARQRLPYRACGVPAVLIEPTPNSGLGTANDRAAGPRRKRAKKRSGALLSNPHNHGLLRPGRDRREEIWPPTVRNGPAALTFPRKYDKLGTNHRCLRVRLGWLQISFYVSRCCCPRTIT